MTRSLPGLLATAALAALALFPAAAGAQTSSFKGPIRVIVPYAPGGGTDAGARLLATGLSRELGQNVIVENRTGASGQIGTQFVQNAAPDGQTVLFTVDHSLIVVPLITPEVKYDVSRDFIGLGLGFRSAWALSVPPQAPYAKELKDYLAAVRRDPQVRTYGVSYTGGAPEAVGQALGKAAGVELTPVPFAGSAPVMQNVMAGQLPAGSTGMPEAVRLHQTGKVKVLGVTGPVRSPLLPDVPTFKELGVPGLEVVRTLIGFFAPKGFPAQMASEFNAALRRTLADPLVLEKLRQMSLEPAPTTLEEATQEVADAQQFWKAQLAAGKR